MTSYTLVLLLLVGITGSQCADLQLTIGKVTSMDETVNGVVIQKYLNIKYADKPNRFAAPMAMSKVMMSDRICPQVAEAPITDSEISEDCLTLSIYRHSSLVPAPAAGRIAVLLPSLTSTSGSCKGVNLAILASEIRGVAVCVQSRLGVFSYGSFMNYNLNTQNNFGLWDQEVALKLIKANAAVLTANTKHTITLIGAGAGAAEVLHRLLLPSDTNMVDQAMIFDGTINNYYSMPRTVSMEQTKSLAMALGCTGTPMDCLKTQPHQTIVSKQGMFVWGMNFMPANDRDMSNLLEARINMGDFDQVPLFLGRSTGAGYHKLLRMKDLRRKMTADELAQEFNTEAKVKSELSMVFMHLPPWNKKMTDAKSLRSIFAQYYPSCQPGDGTKAASSVAMAISDYMHSVDNVAQGRARVANATIPEAHYVVYTHQDMNKIYPVNAVIPTWARPTLGSYFTTLFQTVKTNAFKTMVSNFISNGKPGNVFSKDLNTNVLFPKFLKNKYNVVHMDMDNEKATILTAGYRCDANYWWKVRLPDMITYPEPPVPEPEPAMGPLIAIIVGMVIVVVIGVLIGFCIHKSSTKKIRKNAV